MSILLPLALLLVAVSLLAFLGTAGLWSNLITLVNVVVAGLLAMNFFEPLAGWIAGMLGGMFASGPYYADLTAIWGLFAGILFALKFATDNLSRIKVKFPRPLEMAGSYVVIAAISWIMICFTAATLHMAPLAREFMYGAFNGEKPAFFGFAPDHYWLGFVQRTSQGAFGRGHIFDDQGTFVFRYAGRRELFDRTAGGAAPEQAGS
jgi:hypothetical protein